MNEIINTLSVNTNTNQQTISNHKPLMDNQITDFDYEWEHIYLVELTHSLNHNQDCSTGCQ